MSSFDKFVKTAKKTASGVAKETVKLTDIAASNVRIKTAEARLCDKYEALGRISEKYLRDMPELPEDIAEALDNILFAAREVKKLKTELQGKKAKYDGEKKPQTEGDDSGSDGEAH